MGHEAEHDGRARRPRRMLATTVALVLGLGVFAAIVTQQADTAGSEIVTTTVLPAADAYVESTTATTNYGSSSRLIADNSPVRQVFLKFNLAALSGPVQSARLRIHVANITDSQSPSGGNVALVNNTTWTEPTINYNNRPTSWGSNVASFGAVSRNTWVEANVTSIVTSGSTLTVGIRSTNGDGAYYDSRENTAFAPQLVVTTDTPTSTSSSSSSTSSTTTSSTATTLPQPTTTATVLPVADAYVESTTAATNYGSSTRLIVDNSPVRQSFLRFDLSALSGPVQSARLRIHVANVADSQSPSGGNVALVNNTTWAESTINYNNRPTSWGTNVASFGAVSRNTWVEVDVTGAVTVGSTVTLGIRSTNGDGAYYDSRQNTTFAPQLIVTAGTVPTTTTSSTTTTTTTQPPYGDERTVIAAVGDMVCKPSDSTTANTCRQMQISSLILDDPEIEEFIPLGDLQYDGAELANLQTVYQASYGRVKGITRPIPGNHEYQTPGAAGYYSYFGAAAGDPSKGYYSFDIGESWHVVALNANCGIVSCSASSPQVQWMRADLAANTRPCVISAWHQPRFSSGNVNGGSANTAPFWDVMQEFAGEIVLGGHEHNYERFDLQLPDSTPSPNGMRQFNVGTGGRSLYPFAATRPNSAVRLQQFGILKLVLGPGTYSWQFVAEDGSIRDSGSGTCR